jgi:hypothetical protein
MSTVFLHPIRKTFYRRIQIPQKIRKHFHGRVEVWRSLKTADRDQAEIRAGPIRRPNQEVILGSQEVG